MGKKKQLNKLFSSRDLTQKEFLNLIYSKDINSDSNFTHKNRYDVLSEASDSETDMEINELTDKANEIIKKRARDSSPDEAVAKRVANNPKPKVSPKNMPFIVVRSKITQDEIKTLRGTIKGELHIQYIGHNNQKLKTYSEDDFKKCTDYLKSKNHQFFSHSKKGMGNKKIVLRGLDPHITCEEITADLKESKINVTHVKQMTKINKQGETYNIPIYVIVVAADTNIQSIKNVRYVCSYSAIWEKLKSSNYVLQCYNCQNFGHSSSTCNMASRCVKCDKTHQRGECQVKKDINMPTCCNCKGPHPANYKKCPKALAFLAHRKEAKEKLNLVAAPKPPPLTKKYSEVATAKSQPTATQKPATTQEESTVNFGNVLEQLQSLLSNFDLDKLLKNLQEYLPKFKSANGVGEIMMLGFEFLNKILRNGP